MAVQIDPTSGNTDRQITLVDENGNEELFEV